MYTALVMSAVLAQPGYDDGPPPIVPGYIAQMQKQLNGVSAMQSRLQSDVTDVKEELRLLNNKLDALAKVVAPAATFKASTQDEWGRGAVASFSSGQVQTNSMMMSGYSSGTTARRGRMMPFRGVLRAGGC